jgi:hypothetical protein
MCFCFSSINTSLKHFADESRSSLLIIKKDDSEIAGTRWDGLKKQIFDTFTAEYSQRMLARSLKNLKTLQENCETFATAATLFFPTRRLADQIGTILAGTYLCYSTKKLERKQAIEWLEKQDWTEQTIANEQKDEGRLLERIASYRVRVGMVDATIGELIIVANKGNSADVDPLMCDTDIYGVTPSQASRELGRWGIKVKQDEKGEDGVVFASRCETMKKILTDTPWVAGWARPMKDMSGAMAWPTTYFSPGINARGIWLPIKHFEEFPHDRP